MKLNLINNQNSKNNIPVITIICGVISITLFIGINMEPSLASWDVYKKWGAPSFFDIFNGSYWGLITTNFLHVELWHIGFNLYWLWHFGKKIEFESGKLLYTILILSAALCSSIGQLSLDVGVGMGLSGIIYAFFGFILVKTKTSEAYKDFLPKRDIILFVVWFFVCIYLTKTNLLNVGNGAHFTGFVWGVLLGYMNKFKMYLQWTIGIIFLFLMASAIFWNPFSTVWLSQQAYSFHLNQNYDEAIVMYKRILEKDKFNQFALENLKQLEINKLQTKATNFHISKQYDEVFKVYHEILDIDSNNEWAIQNLKNLQIFQLQTKALELHERKHYSEARKVYYQILKMDKNNDWAIENLKILALSE